MAEFAHCVWTRATGKEWGSWWTMKYITYYCGGSLHLSAPDTRISQRYWKWGIFHVFSVLDGSVYLEASAGPLWETGIDGSLARASRGVLITACPWPHKCVDECVQKCVGNNTAACHCLLGWGRCYNILIIMCYCNILHYNLYFVRGAGTSRLILCEMVCTNTT